MSEKQSRDIKDIMNDLRRINQEFREKIRDGTKNQ